jgi:hypothetical protein
MMKDSVLAVDPKRYGRLLARKLPTVMRTQKENERLIGELEEFDRRSTNSRRKDGSTPNH